LALQRTSLDFTRRDGFARSNTNFVVNRLAQRTPAIDGSDKLCASTALMPRSKPPAPSLSPELVCLLLSMYAFAMFGYITATLASFFVGPRTGGDRSGEAGVEAELARLRRELHTLTVKLERG
jgi:hypothetical protein